MPSVFTTSTSLLFLIPGCLLVLALGALMLNGYRTSREPVLLFAGLGFFVLVGLALWLETYFALLPAFVVALGLYLRAAGEPPAEAPASGVVEVVFRVQAAQAQLQFGTAGALQQAATQGYWEQRLMAPPGTPLLLHVAGPPGQPLAAELWCNGTLLASQHGAASPLTLHAQAQPAA